MFRRKLDRACRELDRERMKMEQQERRVKIEIKKVAKLQQIDAARILAKDLVRVRTHISKMYQMRTQLQSISMQMSAMRTQEAMAGAMGDVTQMMTKMNRSMNLPALQKVMMQFEMEQGKMEMKSELIDDALDEMTGAEQTDEAERILQEVMTEAGMSDILRIGGSAAPTSGVPTTLDSEMKNDAEIEKRLNNLRR